MISPRPKAAQPHPPHPRLTPLTCPNCGRGVMARDEVIQTHATAPMLRDVCYGSGRLANERRSER